MTDAQIAPRDEDAPPACAAAKTDIGTEPYDTPGVTAARVLLPQNNDVIEKERHWALRARLRHGREV